MKRLAQSLVTLFFVSCFNTEIIDSVSLETPPTVTPGNSSVNHQK